MVDFLPEGYVLLDWVASCAAINPEGQMVLVSRKSENLPPWNAIGMLTSALDDLRDSLRDPIPMDTDDEDDEEED